ncbi:Serine/threonine-protein kinase 16 [Allomyces arbusculus]|nr:Serine/threonine-protein kinase 16 [Allomyces arbusculus]
MNSLVHGFRVMLYALYSLVDKNHDSCVNLNGRKLLYQRKIAEGGFGTVFLVRDLSAPHGAPGNIPLYALKRVQASDVESRHTFESEVKAHGAVTHPHVMRLVASAVIPGASGPQGFLLMPYYSNGNLHDFIDLRLQRHQPLSLDFLLSLFRTMCQGVLAFHLLDPPCVVRDIKPANFLIADHGRGTVLTDLGGVVPAARVVHTRAQADALQDDAAIHVTAAFRPPELFSVPSQCALDTRTDVWSLGACLFFMVFGKMAFDGTETAALAAIDYQGRNDAATDLIKSMLQIDMHKRPMLPAVLDALAPYQ